jgi:glycosyltransferase involved in cell wall biosynthesis
MKLVSVIIPCFNHAFYLREALESVLAQTYPHVEIVVVDDGSTDDPAKVVNQFAGVRFVRQENHGPGTARNKGFKQSSGDYLVFLDADDRLLPEAVETGLRFLDANPALAFVSGHCRYIDLDGSQLHIPSQLKPQEDHYLALLRRNYILAGSTVIHRRHCLEEVGGYDGSVRIKGAEDYDLYLRLTRIFPVACHGLTIAEYRQYGLLAQNVSNHSGKVLGATLAALRRQRRFVKENSAYLTADRAGIQHKKQLWGTMLIEDLRFQLTHDRAWKQIANDMLVLLRYNKIGLIRYLIRTARSLAHE